MSVRLFVGNLSFDVTEAELKELFSAAGTPTQVRLPTDRESGRPRGFAFVDFGDRAEAEKAIQRFDQHVFKGRALAVNEARAREARPAGGAGSAGARPAPRPRPAPHTSYAGAPVAAPDPDGPQPGQPRRTFGPDAPSRGKRKNKGRGFKEERGPKGPLREQGGGQLFFGADDDDDDQGLDDFALWQREDANKQNEE